MKKRWLFDGVVGVGIVAFSTWLMFHSFDYSNGNFIFSSKVWSDFGAHIPLIRSFSLGSNIPPEYATFPGEPIKYHFLFYLFVALLEKTGMNIAIALNSLSILGFSLMLWMVYRYVLLFSMSRLAGFLALLLVLFNGTLGFLNFFAKYPLNVNSLMDIVTAEHFTSFGPWDGKLVSAFWNLNIYTNQRHLSLSFAIILFALYPVVKKTITGKRIHKKWWYILPPLFMMMPWLHQATISMLLVVIIPLFVIEWSRLRSMIFPYLMCIVLALPGYLYWQYAGITSPVIEYGYLAKDKSILGIAMYWWHNLGFYLPLIPVIWLLLPKRRRVILSAFLILFVLTNMFRLSTDMINNHKLINFLLLYLAVETGILLSHLLKRWYSFIPGLWLLFFLTFSGVIDFFPILNDRRSPFPDIPHNETAAWIVQSTPKDSIFLTTHYLYHPASIAGRKLFLDYGYFNWSMGYKEETRRRFVKNLFNSELSHSDACVNLALFSIDYLAVSPGQGEVSDRDPHQAIILSNKIPMFSSTDGYTIYSVKDLCSDISEL